MDQEQYEKIEQYLENQLAPEEKAAFEAKIEQDESLKQAVEEQRLSHEAIELVIEDNLRGSFAQWKKEEGKAKEGVVKALPTTTPSKKNWKLGFAIAAAVLALLVFGWIKWGMNSYTNEQILADHFQSFIPSDLRSTVAASGMNEGLTAFENQDYSTAINRFLSVPDTSIQYAAAQYSLGHSYFANKNYDSASQTFKNVVDLGDVRYQEKAEWYLLLTYIAQEQKDEAFSKLLNAIASDPNHSYYKPAQEIREKIEG